MFRLPAPCPQDRHFPLLAWGLLGATVLLWAINWYANRPLFLDEANVARNLFDRGPLDFFRPLDHRQYAPPGYLLLAKAFGELFGYGERALRLPSLLAGVATALLWCRWALRQATPRWAGLLPLGLLAANPVVLRYVTELKPYAFDLLGGTILLLGGLRSLRPTVGWALAGVLLPWCSLPSVFGLAAVGLAAIGEARGWGDRFRWAAIGAGWLLSFGVLYFFVLRPSLGDGALLTYHQPYFFPVWPLTAETLQQAIDLLLSLPKLAYGYTAVAMAAGTLVAAVGARAGTGRERWLALLPVVLVLLVSALKSYTLLPRLLLFILPGAYLLAVRGTQWLARWDARLVYPLLLAWALTLGGTNVVRHYADPMKFSDARPLALAADPGYQLLAHPSAVPVLDYYHRIHPASRTPHPSPILDEVAQLARQPTVIAYDVLTSADTRAALSQDSLRAVKAGFTVEFDSLLYSGHLYLTPE